MLTLAELASQLGVSTGTVKTWYHAGFITGHPYNDKGQCLYPPPGKNPPARAQGRKLSERHPARHTAPADNEGCATHMLWGPEIRFGLVTCVSRSNAVKAAM